MTVARGSAKVGLQVSRTCFGVAALQRAIVLRVIVGDLRTHQDDLRRIIDPDQHDDDRGSGSGGRFQPLFADIEADGGFPGFKEQRSEKRAQPNVTPANPAPSS
jgi:hypothetical protein